MQIKIKESTFKNAIGYLLDNYLYEEYGSEILKKAAVPKRAELINQFANNSKFVKGVLQYLNEQIDDGDIFYDAVCDSEIPMLTKLVERCDEVTGEIENQESEKEEEKQIKRMIKVLEDNGYKITKK